MFFPIILILCLSLSSSLEIPGCPDIARLSATANDLEGEKLDLIKCVCGSQEEGRIEVNCVFGASFDDLATVLNTITKLNGTVQQINLNHVSVSNKTSLLGLLSSESARNIESIEIKNCHGGALEFNEATNETSKLQELQMLTIENCGLIELPAALIARTTKLQSVSLNNNKIEFIAADQLKSAANSLEYLDLTENLFGNIENGSFKQLEHLRTLLIGEHNFANETLLEEVAQIESLETLDLSRIDGINSVEQLEFLDGNRLERLVLTGCNIKSINSSDFSAFSQLKELDMRVNLIEKLEPNSFGGLHNLERISLAGNFLRDSEIRADRWTDLKNLTQLDLGWNEIKRLRERSFGSEIGENLRILSLRSNEKLVTIEDNAFLGLESLVNLNLSGSALDRLDGKPFNGLGSLELLDLSSNNITSIGPNVFEPNKKTLKHLNLANNKLRLLDVDTLFDLDFSALEELDLSNNNWLCDENILKVPDWIRSQYSNAAKHSKTFFLANAAKTVCDRPYRLQGKNLMDLKVTDVGSTYDEKTDTTAVTPVVENVTEQVSQETTTLIDFSKLILDIGTKNDSLDVNADEGKPSYDINLIKYGQKPVKEADNAWVSVVVVGLLILTIAAVLFAIRQRIKRSENEAPQAQQTSSEH